MNKNLYVGNLSYKVTDEDLRSNFSEAGEVASVTIIKDKFNGQSKGFGFVEMKTEEGAAEAIKNSMAEHWTVRPSPSTRLDRRRNLEPAAVIGAAAIGVDAADSTATDKNFQIFSQGRKILHEFSVPLPGKTKIFGSIRPILPALQESETMRRRIQPDAE